MVNLGEVQSHLIHVVHCLADWGCIQSQGGCFSGFKSHLLHHIIQTLVSCPGTRRFSRCLGIDGQGGHGLRGDDDPILGLGMVQQIHFFGTP